MTNRIIFTIIFLLSSKLLSLEINRQRCDSLSTVDFSFVGDIMCHSTQFKFAKVGKDSFNFKPVYREIKPYFDNSDVIVGNLETVIEVKGVNFSGYPVFNTPKEFLEGLKYAGFNFLSTSNNHTFDINEHGVLSTLKHIKNIGLKNVGTYSSQSNRDSVVINEKNGIKFAILSYTYDVNLYEIPESKSYLVNRIDKKIIENDIKNYRKKGADLVIVFFHFGLEYAKSPNSYQKEIVKKTINFGADIIIGSHPHTLQPIEYFKSNNSNIDSGFVAYSLGNFISNQRWRYSDGGAILNFTIEKNQLNGKISLAEVRYLPIWVYKGQTENGSEYIILPTDISVSDSIPNYLSKEDLRLMSECSEDTYSILTNFTKNIEIDSIKKSKLRRMKRDYLANKIFVQDIPVLHNKKNIFINYSDTLSLVHADSTLKYQIYD
ncbi:MAG: CapA family protein [Bacteroidetes bacterium]|nr:CapA family protein [Bacteroidota bacterium]MBU1114758.1 CapA family protein [Bacteroidota bacterium]MBU1797781.1 CapA family protein [Bacteroidota bacterium]